MSILTFNIVIEPQSEEEAMELYLRDWVGAGKIFLAGMLKETPVELIELTISISRDEDEENEGNGDDDN